MTAPASAAVRRIRIAAWSLWALAASCAVAVVGVVVATGAPLVPVAGTASRDLLDAAVALLLLSYATTGALVAARRPEHPIGWLLLLGGVAIEVEQLAGAAAAHADRLGVAWQEAVTYLALFGDALWIPSLALTSTLVLLLFPDGRLPSGRWRVVVAVVVLASALFVPSTVFAPGELYYLPERPNPLGVPALGGFLEAAQSISTAAVFLCLLLGVVALVRRSRRADGVQRTQLRWFQLSIAALALAIPLDAMLTDHPIGSMLFEFAWALPPIAIGIAVLRYRLYEIDRIVSRTVTYALVTVVLAGLYVLVAVVPAVTLDLDSDLLVAAATLAGAAAFGPVRRRVQGWVDRRFNRARFDAQQVVEHFAARLRDEVELQRLLTDTRRVVRETIQPAHVSLWLGEGTP